MSEIYIGFDTSNYTTSIAICSEDGVVLENIKKLLPVKDGERGLRQSDAVFAHNKNIPLLTEDLKIAMKKYGGSSNIGSVGYSAYPRDCEGSYMPCFLVGKSIAMVLASTLGCPVYPFSHQAGHVMAALYSSGMSELQSDKFIAFHVSGGTTEVLLVKKKDIGFEIDLIGGSDDINAGQAIDRTGVKMGMKFPCGREMENTLIGKDIQIQKVKISQHGTHCNLSGLENLARCVYERTGDVSLTSAYVFDYIAETLYKMTDAARQEYGKLPVLYAGGVMSNSRIKKRLSDSKDVYFALPEFSSDNAAGIALLCRNAHKSDMFK